MNKNTKILVWIVTGVFAAMLILLIGTSIVAVQKQTEETCFAYLDEATHSLAADLYRTVDMDHTILTAMATIIADEKNPSDANVCAVINNYDSEASYVNYVEVLRPDNTILDADGSVRDVSASLNFEEEVQKGSYLTDITYSTKNPEERIIRNAVPVVDQDGETVFMLYGVIRLNDFAEAYTTNIYGGKAYVYLEDGETGDFLLDTWHRSFGNISDFFDRENTSEDSFEDAARKMKEGRDGDLSFVSQSTGDTLYMHYEPIGINNWNVIVTVQDRYALRDSEAITAILYRMAGITAIVVALYMGFVIILLLLAYRHIRNIGLNDVITGLQNRNAYDAFISNNQNKKYVSAACVYVDVNGLHELNNREGHKAGDQMLRRVADALRSEFPPQAVFRAGGDEFVVLVDNMDDTVCQRKAEQVEKLLKEQGYSIAYGVAVQEDATGFADVIYSADDQMLLNKKQYYSMHDRRMR